jgi:RNA polymerase sigma factor (sigma-70 family)
MKQQRANNEWIDGVQNDDPTTYRELIEMFRRFALDYLNDIHYYAANMHVGMYESIAEDAAQDSIIRIRNRIHQYKSNALFTTWAYSIVRYRVLDILRKNRIELKHNVIEAARRVAPYYIDNPDAYELTMVLEIIRNDLTDRQRYVMTATIDGLSDKQIASDLGINVNAVYKIRFDTRTKILDLMSRQ